MAKIMKLNVKGFSNQVFDRISFFSKKIKSFQIEEEILILTVDQDVEEDFLNNLREYLNKYNEHILKYENNSIENEVIYTSIESIFKSDYIDSIGDGLFFYNEGFIELFNYFDKVIREVAMKFNAIEKKYTTLLPIEPFNKTGYFEHSPQYTMCACELFSDINNHKNLNEIEVQENGFNNILTPAACFPVYLDYQNKMIPPTLITLLGKVYRNEGKINWGGFGKFREFHVREIVIFGSNDYIESLVEMIQMELDKKMVELGFDFKKEIAFDSFVLPNLERVIDYQVEEVNKIEYQMPYAQGKYISVGSINKHKMKLTNSFNIKSEKEELQSACIAFGIERLVLVFLAQFGINPDLWGENGYGKTKTN
ncbi:hypothetical protein HCA06_13910 [Listeria welshimeri]|nr:hypothetical protein [Listeria welshimeri]